MKIIKIRFICSAFLTAALVCTAFFAIGQKEEAVGETPTPPKPVSDSVRKAYLSYPDSGYVAYPGGIPTPTGAFLCTGNGTELIRADDPRLIRLTNCISHAMYRMAGSAEGVSGADSTKQLVLCFEEDGDGDSIRYVISGQTVCRVYRAEDGTEYRSARSFSLADTTVEDWITLAGF